MTEMVIPEEADEGLRTAFIIVVIMCIGVTATGWNAADSFSDNVHANAGALAFVALLLAGLTLSFRRTSIEVLGHTMVVRRSLGPFVSTKTWPADEVRVAVGSFSFAPWDHHLVIHHGDEVIRIGAGLSETHLNALVESIRTATHGA